MQRSINKTSRRWRIVELEKTNRHELTTWYTSWLYNIDYVHILQCIAAYTFCQWFLVINQNKPSRRLNQKRFRQKLKVIFIVDLSQNHAIWIDIKRQRLKIELKMEIRYRSNNCCKTYIDFFLKPIFYYTLLSLSTFRYEISLLYINKMTICFYIQIKLWILVTRSND